MRREFHMLPAARRVALGSPLAQSALAAVALSQAQSTWSSIGWGVLLVVALGLLAYTWRSVGSPIALVISDAGVRYRGQSVAAVWEEFAWADVEATEWIGHDNAAFRLRSGKVATVSYFVTSEADREEARTLLDGLRPPSARPLDLSAGALLTRAAGSQ